MLGSYIPVKSNENLQNSLELGINCQSSPLELNSKVILFNQSSAVAGVFIYSDKKLIPIVVGVALNNEQNALFRIRRFGYSYEYMKRFLCKSEGSLICTLNGELFTSLSQ